MASSTGIYNYQPLTGSLQTRLLHLAPGTTDDVISGRLKCVSLVDCPPYEALSYEWGDPKKSCTMRLEDGSTAHITRSLHHALRDIRHEAGASRLIWADGICINQEDLEERQRQVRLMGKIYRGSVRVITYIGPETNESSTAISFARYLIAFSNSLGLDGDARLHSAAELANVGLPALDDTRWNALKALLLRGWAGRCWCAQEFLLNNSLIMMCGRFEIPDWELVPKIVQFVFNRTLPAFILPNPTEDPSCLRECLVAMMRLRKLTEQKTQMSLFHFLNILHPLQATDPRDKVYSVIGLALDYNKINLPIDYSCSIEQLYTEVARQLITTGTGVELLYSNLHVKSFNLPSWVPDWSFWQFGSHGTTSRDGYAASGRTREEVRIGSPDTRLEISGCLIDKVVWLSSNIGDHYLHADTEGSCAIPQRRQWLEEQAAVARRLQPYPDGSNTTDILWKALIGNVTFYERQATDSYRAHFHAHFNLGENSTTEDKDMAREFCDATRRRSRYRRLAVTKLGYFTAVPHTAEIGDWLCMFHGAKHLYLVRENGSGFTYLGHAYGHGLMNGEALRLKGYYKRTITLV